MQKWETIETAYGLSTRMLKLSMRTNAFWADATDPVLSCCKIAILLTIAETGILSAMVWLLIATERNRHGNPRTLPGP